jgi:Raf kinase inhibitor-like YbhB/YbcL family protein
MRLTSSVFAPNGRIPVQFTCDGANVSPPLTWSDPPAGTLGFALICADPDAPGGVWHHWGVYNIPPQTQALPEHWREARTAPSQAINDFGRAGYGGPCPPRGDAAHHYHFRLHALNVAQLSLGPHARCQQVDAAVRLHTIAVAELVGLYGRP